MVPATAAIGDLPATIVCGLDLRICREVARATQLEVAVEIGVSQQAVAAWETRLLVRPEMRDRYRAALSRIAARRAAEAQALVRHLEVEAAP